MVKRFLMVQLWRIQQSYTLLSLLIWGVIITFTSWAVLEAIWADVLQRFGISMSAPGAVASGLAVIFICVFTLLYAVGVIYDKYLRLWREQLDVSVEKNPYTQEKLMVKEILMWRHMFLPTLRAIAPEDPDAQREIEFMEDWIQKSIASDGNIRKALDQAERWITESRAETE
jgi:hypothetical protein